MSPSTRLFIFRTMRPPGRACSAISSVSLRRNTSGATSSRRYSALWLYPVRKLNRSDTSRPSSRSADSSPMSS